MCKIMNVFGQNGRENLWMFFQAVIAVYLLILSVIDIRWKKVSVRSLLILGILSGGWNLLWILFAAFLIASVYGEIMIARKKYTRKNSFPFIPFLTVAYLGGMIGGVY